MIAEVLFIAFIVLYWFAEGCTEGYTWANGDRRMVNVLVSGRWKVGRGILDYHAWRILEGTGIVGAIVSGWFIHSVYSFVSLLVGAWIVGNYIYERALNYVVYGFLYWEKSPFQVVGISIKRSMYAGTALFVGGVALIVWGLFYA